MILGVFGDTHGIDANVIKHIIGEFKRREVDKVIHCGDIEPQHLSAELFGNLPVYCALNLEQVPKEAFKVPPPGWIFTTPDNRVWDIDHVRCYIGHKFAWHLTSETDGCFKARLDTLRKDHDGLRWVFAGHTHHQVSTRTLHATFVNPGAVDLSPDGFEFAIIDTESGQVDFSRIPKTKHLEPPFTIGIISDSLNISKLDADFWQKLKKEFQDRDVSQVIHLGNIAVNDIGLKEFDPFQVHYRLRRDQRNPTVVPSNWHLIEEDPPIVVINDRQFYIHPSLARIVLEKSEADMHRECLLITEQFPEISFILYGNATDAYLSEEMDGRTRIMNPGNALSRSFATVCLPRCEITLGTVPFDPLPQI